MGRFISFCSSSMLTCIARIAASRFAANILCAIVVALLLPGVANAADGKVHVGNTVLKENYRHKGNIFYLPLSETIATFGMKAHRDGSNVVIQDTIHGDIKFPMNSKAVEIDGTSIDFSSPPIERGGALFYPRDFFEKVLGLFIHSGSSGVDLYVSRGIHISGVGSDGVSIEYPYPLSYTDFELDDGDSIRLVVDFDGGVLDGEPRELPDIDTEFRNFRASQFTREPDVVRVVLELQKKDGIKPKYSIDNKHRGLWIGLKLDAFNVKIEATKSGCEAMISGARYKTLKSALIEEDGSKKLALDFTKAIFPKGLETTNGIGVVSKIRIGQNDGYVRVVFDLLDDPEWSVEELAGGRVKVIFKGRQTDLAGRVIVIDPGHGGKDNGADREGIFEKNLNLEMALSLADELRKAGATIFMTRTSDVTIELPDRLAYGQKHNADLFICLHNNSTRQPVTEAHGPMLIYDDKCEYIDLLSLIYGEMVKNGGREGAGVRPDDRGLYILNHRGDLNVVLIESAFLNNPYDLKLLTQPEGEFKRDVMHGVAVGIIRYFTGQYTAGAKVPETSKEFDSDIFCLVDETGLTE